MFEILFGWRKASKCKRLIKRVQFRLEVLKNKRESIIRQLQQDVVHLIKTGHHSSAISRIEQIYRDQTVKAGYDLLHSFSEFIIINLSYIRKHRDCPNDINEAVSSLLYASARFGDLPELPKLRKLFCERYGQTFATTAVELLHGNLVNRQIIENLSAKSASDDLKLKLLKEIARDNGIQIDRREINGVLELKCQQQSDTDDGIDAPKLQVSCEKEVHEIAKSDKSFDIEKNTVTSASARVWSCNSSRIHSVNLKNHEETDPLCEAQAVNSELSASPLQHKLERITEVEPESPSRFSKRQLVYLDDAHDKEKSLLMVKSSITSVTQSPAAITHKDHKERGETYDENSSSQGATKRTKPSRRRLKWEHSSMKDVEAALYYGEPDYLSPDDNLFSRRSDPQGKHRQKMTNAESQSSQKKPATPISPAHFISNQRNCIDITVSHTIVADCSLENPCYFITSDDHDDLKSPYSTWFPQGKNHEDEHNFYSSSDEAFSTDIHTSHKAFGLETNNGARKMEEAEVMDSRRSCPSSRNSSRVASPWGRVRDPYLRTMTMPTERTKETPSHRIVRSASYLPDQHNRSNIGSPSYIHPKLPDYEDLSARFRSLKTKSVAM